MDKIGPLLKAFSELENREFRYFLVRHRPKNERKDLRLLQELKEEDRLEKWRGVDAYHSQRRRISRQLMEYVSLLQTQVELEGGNQLSGSLAMARFLFSRKMNELAWHYLMNAEKSGLESERYDLLSGVYLLMIENAHHSTVYTLEELFGRLKVCKRMADEDERLSCAIAMIRRKMEEIKQTGDQSNFSGFIEQVLDSFQLSTSILNRPIHLYRIMEIVRSSYLAMRNLTNFESMVIEQYHRFDHVAGKEDRYHEIRMSFVYMIAHVLYHNRKYAECEQWLGVLDKLMQKNKGRHARKYAAQYHSLYSSILSFRGKNQEAILHLEKVIEDWDSRLISSDFLNLRLNLTFAYFIAQDYRKANRFFLFLDQHSDAFYIRKMGQEWLLRCKMIRSIVQYELGNEDLSLNQIRQIERSFSDLLQQPVYLKAKNFLGFLKLYMTDPYAVSFADFHQRALKELFVLPAGTEESKAIAFYCWLKARLMGRDYYSVLLEEVNSRPEE